MDNVNIEYLFQILLFDKPSLLINENEKYIFNIIPELQKCKGFNQKNKWHIYDVYEHILHVVDGVPKNIYLRLSALFHDIGKPYVMEEDELGIGHFYGHWNKSNEIFLKFANENNIDKEIIDIVSKLIYYHDINIAQLDETNLNNMLKILNISEIEMLFELKKSDLLAQSPKFHYILDNNEKQKIKLLEIKEKVNFK